MLVSRRFKVIAYSLLATGAAFWFGSGLVVGWVWL